MLATVAALNFDIVELMLHGSPSILFATLRPGIHSGNNFLFYFLERFLQLIGIISREVFTAPRIGNTHQLLAFILRDIKAHHMHLDLDALLAQLSYQRAGVALAGFLAVADQHHRRFVFQHSQLLRCLLEGFGDRGLAAWRDRFDLPDQRLAIAGAHRNQHLDVIAIAPAAMAIDLQAGADVGGQFPHQAGHHLLGDDDLVLALDLAPHAARTIEDEQNIARSRARLGKCGRRNQPNTHDD